MISLDAAEEARSVIVKLVFSGSQKHVLQEALERDVDVFLERDRQLFRLCY